MNRGGGDEDNFKVSPGSHMGFHDHQRPFHERFAEERDVRLIEGVRPPYLRLTEAGKKNSVNYQRDGKGFEARVFECTCE